MLCVAEPIQNTWTKLKLRRYKRQFFGLSKWLDRYGETSYDHQSFFASDLARAAKALYYKKPLLGTLAVSPMIFCEAFLPSARRLFWKPTKISHCGRSLRDGFCFPLARSGAEAIL